MNSEDERAFRAARRLRKQFAKLDPALLADKATFVDRAAALLGLDILNLPPDDPLLAGADGMIDRDYETIWLSNSLNPLMRRVTIAHEIGHFILHAPRFVAGDDGDEGDLIGYSQNQRDERDAHRFASEFLVPQSIIRSKFLSGLGVRHIAAEFEVPRALVQRQLIESFSGKDFETSTDNEFIGPLDDWQRDASRASGPAIVIGSRGTGKTTVLLARCSYLVNEFNADPRRILVVAASQLQADFIRQNLFSRIIDLSLISVSTPGQLAYDILVRFGKELDLTLPWEDVDAKNDGKTMGRRLIDAALNLARNYPVLLEKLRGRFDHIMIDSVNLMNQSALDVVQAAVSSEQALWMSVTREAYELAVRHTSNPRYFSLPCQYRVAPAINRWISALRGIDEKHDLDHRAENPRSGRGTVTIAVAETSDQLASGIEEFLHSKFHDRYSLDDVLIACPPSSTKLYAALQTKIFRALSADEITEKKYIGDFQCWLELCANNWSAPTLFQIGRLPEYDLEPGGLFQAAQDCLATTDFNGRLDLLRKSFGEAGLRLAEQLSGSCTVRSNRERLLTYLFELSDYVRARPGCGHAIERFLTEIDLDASRSNTGFVGQATRQHVIRSSNDLLSRHNKIAVVTECDIVELLTIISGRGRVESVNREIGAAAAASEHLLYGVVTKKPLKALDSAGKIKRSTPWIEIRDWTGIKSHTAENAISSSKASEDKALFKQCPRRVYYRRALDSAETIPSDLINYPAKPADVSLCAACLYKLICPSLIS